MVQQDKGSAIQYVDGKNLSVSCIFELQTSVVIHEFWMHTLWIRLIDKPSPVLYEYVQMTVLQYAFFESVPKKIW